jgi:hypothetical protein
MILQKPYMILSWILDMLWELVFRLCATNLHKVTEGIFLYKLSSDIDKSA